MAKNNKMQQTKEKLLDSLSQCMGIVTAACQLAEINRTTFYRYLNEDEEFAAAVQDVENVAIDYAEGQLFKLMKEKNVAAVIFYLKTKGKKRGYTEDFNMNHRIGLGSDRITLILPEQFDEAD